MLGKRNKRVHAFFQRYNHESERNSATRVLTHLFQCHSTVQWAQRHGDLLLPSDVHLALLLVGETGRVWRTIYGRERETNHLPLWDEVEIIDRAEHWMIRPLKESAHMLGYNDLLSRPNIELNTIWKPIIKKVRWKKYEYEHR